MTRKIKPTVEIEEKIFTLVGEEFQGEKFLFNKISEGWNNGLNRQKRKPKTNIAIVIDGEQTEIDFGSTFVDHEFYISGINNVKGHSILSDREFVVLRDGIFILKDGEDEIKVSLVDVKTGRPVLVQQIKTPVFQMSSQDIPEDTIESWKSIIKSKREEINSVRKQKEVKSKFNKETEKYVKEKMKLISDGWSEHSNGNLRMFKKNADAMVFLIEKDSFKVLDYEEVEDGRVIIELGEDRAIAEPDGDGIKLTKLKTTKSE